MDTTSSSRFPITDTSTLPVYQSHHYYHRSMSNCALRSFSQEDDSISSATSTTRGRRRFRRVKTLERINPPLPTSQQEQHQHTNESSHQLNTEFISNGLYEVSIRIKEDPSRPPNTSISDRCEFLQPLNDTTNNNDDDDDESSISSMSSYGDATSSIIHNNNINNNNNNKNDALQIDETTATDISSDEKNDKKSNF
jgi:hypothetical protein